MPTVLRSDASMRLRVELSADVVARYQAQADAMGIELEALLSERLASAIDHTATKPLYFNDTERRELEQIVGKNVATVKDALTALRNLTSVRLQGLHIGLKLPLLTRLRSRCLGMEWEDFIEKIVVEDLERYVGMR